jgi:putative DNA primase/helicase
VNSKIKRLADVANGRRKAMEPVPVFDPDARIVPAPTEPMAVARKVAGALYVSPAGDLILRVHKGDFYLWTGTHYSEIDQPDVRSAMYHWLEHAKYEVPKLGHVPFSPDRRKIDFAIDALRAITLLDSGKDAPCWTCPRVHPPATDVIAMANGLLDVVTRTLQPHTATFFTTHSLPFKFLPEARPEQWLKFLAELWPDDPSAISALQELFGYILGGDTRQQKIFLLVGPKRGGKGTIGRVLTGLLGQHHVAAPTLASLATNFGLQPLIAKPLALISDARLSSRADGKVVVERLLSISGEDSLTIDRKYRDPWTGHLPSRFVILTNELPRLTDSSGALASRFIVFVLTKSFYGQENPGLTDALLAEAPGIFNWAIEGLDRLKDRGHFLMPESGKDAVQQLEDLSSPISAFIRDRCVVASSASVEVDALWGSWKTWCEADNRPPGTKAIFGRDLKAAVPTIKRGRPRTDDPEAEREYSYQGIGLRGSYIPADLGPLGPKQGPGRSGPSGPRDSAMYPPHKRKGDGDGDDDYRG